MPNLAFLMVHGIGDFTAGGALDSAATSLQKRFPNLETVDSTQDMDSRTRSHNYRYGTGTVRLSEFHWSGAFGKLRRLNPVRTLWRIFALFQALPSLGAYGSRRPLQRRLAVFGGWMLWLAAMAMTGGILFLMAATVAEGRAGANASTAAADFAVDILLLSAAIAIVAAAVGVLMYLLSLNRAGRESGRATQWLGLVIGCALLAAYAVVLFYAVLLMALLFFETGTVGMILIMLLVVGPPFVLFSWLLLTVVDLLRDVVAYLAPMRDGSDNAVTTKIKQEVTESLDRLVAEGFDEITLVAHSLGTVIAVEVLLEWEPATGTKPRLRLITCGSPLRRLIAPLLPNRHVEPGEVFDRLRTYDAFELTGWLNLYRVLDPVGQKLFKAAAHASGEPVQKEDRLLTPWRNAPYGHSNYWGDPRFLEEIFSTTSQGN